MKNVKKICIYVTIITLSLLCFNGCKSNNKDTNTNEVTIAPVDTPNPSNNVPPVATQDDTIVTDSDLDNGDSTDKNTDNKDSDKDDEQINNDNNSNTYNITYKDHLTTAEYKVKKDGTYEFKCEPSDKKAYWDIYVLDEPFEDAFRYLANAYTPTLKATKDSKKFELKKGQYVYCVCSENSFTDEGTSDDFSCPLTIKLN